MIQEFANGVLTLLLAKFMLNDVSHAPGLSGIGGPTFWVDYTVEEEVVPEGKRVWGEASFVLGKSRVGRALFTFYEGGDGEIGEFEISPGYRGKGLGSMGYKALEKKARSMGVKKITGFVQPGTLGPYESAKRFWEGVGFTVHPTQEMEKML